MRAPGGEVIRDRGGNVIRRSRNLRGIREHVSGRLVKGLSVDRIGAHEGRLCVLCEDGTSYETTFASFGVLVDFVRRWRNVYGAPLYTGGRPAGLVAYDNPALRISQT